MNKKYYRIVIADADRIRFKELCTQLDVSNVISMAHTAAYRRAVHLMLLSPEDVVSIQLSFDALITYVP